MSAEPGAAPTVPFDLALSGAVVRALQLGVERASAPDADVVEALGGAEHWAWNAAALHAVAVGFERHEAPRLVADESAAWADVRFPSERGRAALVRLARVARFQDGYGPADTAALVAWRALGRAALSPHPFDAGALTHLLHCRHAPEADPVVRRVRRWSDAPLAPEDLAQWPLAERVERVAALRRRDPAAGLALVEAAIEAETARVRKGLVETLTIGAGERDLALLDTLAESDRSKEVRRIASSLAADVRLRLDRAALLRSFGASVTSRLRRLRMDVAEDPYDALLRYGGLTLAEAAGAVDVDVETFVARSRGCAKLETFVALALFDPSNGSLDERRALARAAMKADWRAALRLAGSRDAEAPGAEAPDLAILDDVRHGLVLADLADANASNDILSGLARVGAELPSTFLRALCAKPADFASAVPHAYAAVAILTGLVATARLDDADVVRAQLREARLAGVDETLPSLLLDARLALQHPGDDRS